MNFKDHCNLCDNLKVNLQDGITCGLTNQKPTFNNTCPKIVLSDKFKKELGLIHIKIERLKSKKRLTYTYFYLYMIIGCILILGGSAFMKFTFVTTSLYISRVRLTLIIVGFGLCGFGYSKLNEYRNKIRVAKAEKSRIDGILNKYQIKYTCNVEFGEKYHGNEEVIVELKSKNHLLKNSKSLIKFNDYLN